MNEMTLNLDINSQIATVQETLNSHLQNQGKLFRPKLNYYLGQLLNVNDEDWLLVSRAGELLHNASLIHDDVIDHAIVRRHHPTLNSSLPNSLAVLAGDFLLASVVKELSEKKEFDLLQTISATLQTMVEGEFLQDDLKKKDQISKEDLLEVAKKKTGALIAWNCASIASKANISRAKQQLCFDIGMKIGLVFQLHDDCLDYARTTGKEYAKDLKEGLINFVTLNLIQLYPELYYPIYQLRGSNQENYPWSESQLQEALELTRKQILTIYQEIYNLIDELSDSPKKEEFINYLKSSSQRIF